MYYQRRRFQAAGEVKFGGKMLKETVCAEGVVNYVTQYIG